MTGGLWQPQAIERGPDENLRPADGFKNQTPTERPDSVLQSVFFAIIGLNAQQRLAWARQCHGFAVQSS